MRIIKQPLMRPIGLAGKGMTWYSCLKCFMDFGLSAHGL